MAAYSIRVMGAYSIRIPRFDIASLSFYLAVALPREAPSPAMHPSRDISRLSDTMAALRHPQTGCQGDSKREFATNAP